jgi:p-cumate 2,3-dioxygenase subunit alpha
MTPMNLNGASASDLVIDDRTGGTFRVNRAAFTDSDVFEAERREIFDRSWLYVGHEAEIPKTGDYVARKIAGRPVILVRDDAGAARTLLNSCPHRGNLVCRDRSGNASKFTCFYHAWSFSLDGALRGLPGPDAYGKSFAKSEMGLTPTPRMEIYRGLVFASFDRSIVDLVTYLGDARDYIDLLLDFSGDDLDIAPGAQSYSMRANWKLLVENSIDVYHGMSTHQRFYRQFLPAVGVSSNTWVSWTKDNPGRAIALGNGHAVVETPARSGPIAKAAKAELDQIRARLVEKFGEERAAHIADYGRNLFIFPNLILISTWRTIRTIYPVAPDHMEVDAWALLPRNESASLRRLRMDNFVSFLGPAGFGTPDDAAALEGCQRGFAITREQPWSDISRGMGRDPIASDELQMRAFWRRWRALLAGEVGATDCSDAVPARSAAE